MVPVPEEADPGSLNRRLLAGCDALLDGPRYRRGAPVRELLAEDPGALLPLASARFDCVEV